MTVSNGVGDGGCKHVGCNTQQSPEQTKQTEQAGNEQVQVCEVAGLLQRPDAKLLQQMARLMRQCPSIILVLIANYKKVLDAMWHVQLGAG